jgi:hypothetical protein
MLFDMPQAANRAEAGPTGQNPWQISPLTMGQGSSGRDGVESPTPRG